MSMAKSPAAPKKCFVICPIGEDGSDTRFWSDEIFDHLITPVCEELNISAERSLENNTPGDITLQILTSIYEADIIIADLTGHNPNVFFEVSFGYSQNKPIVLIRRDNLKIPFDIVAMKTITIQTTFSGLATAKNELKKHIENATKGNTLGNPIERFRRHLDIKTSGSNEEKEKEEFRITIEAMNKKMEKLEAVQKAIIRNSENLNSQPTITTPLYAFGAQSGLFSNTVTSNPLAIIGANGPTTNIGISPSTVSPSILGSALAKYSSINPTSITIPDTAMLPTVANIKPIQVGASSNSPNKKNK